MNADFSDTNLKRTEEMDELKKVKCLKVMNGTGEYKLVSGTILKLQFFRAFVGHVAHHGNIEKEISIFLF